jgi:SAM-dependent methyltransferase
MQTPRQKGQAVPVNVSARQVTRCRVCDANDWQDVVSFGPVPLANGFLEPAESYDDEPYYPLGVLSCRSCRLMSVTHVVDPEVLYRTYPYVTSDSETITRHMQYVARSCRERFGLTADSFVVELGSNTGAQLRAFADAGLRTLGVDPARNLAAIANARGVETLPEFFSADTARHISRTYGAASLILGRHVFAHIDDLTGVLHGVRELLAPGGVFAVEVPYAGDLVEKNAFDTIYHEHLSYFTIRSLAALFDRHGMRVFDVERMPVHGGSIFVSVSHGDGPWPVRPSVGEFLAGESAANLYDDAAYRTFAGNVRQLTEDLTALVRRLRGEGKRIAGYGASAKGNTILNVAGIGRADLEFCSDTTELKQGKVLPGTHVPVCSPQEAERRAPDLYLLLAWNYAEEIIRREVKFLQDGGRFIIPIPTPSVISVDTR